MERFDYVTRTYKPHIIPAHWHCPIISDNMDEGINCTSCGEKLTYGESYTSIEIHNQIGLGYPVCRKCYDVENQRRRDDFANHVKDD